MKQYTLLSRMHKLKFQWQVSWLYTSVLILAAYWGEWLTRD